MLRFPQAGADPGLPQNPVRARREALAAPPRPPVKGCLDASCCHRAARAPHARAACVQSQQQPREVRVGW